MSVTNAVLRGTSFGICLWWGTSHPPLPSKGLSKRDHMEEATTKKAELNFPWVLHGAEHNLQPWMLCRIEETRARSYKWHQQLCHCNSWPCLCLLCPLSWGHRDVSCPLSSAGPPSSAPRALKLKAAHWFLAQTPILWNSIHPPSHLEGISHFEWINFIWLLPSTTMLLIHGPPQPLRWGQVHWAALSQTHLLVSHPLGTPLPLSVDYTWTPAALFIWRSYFFFFF